MKLTRTSKQKYDTIKRTENSQISDVKMMKNKVNVYLWIEYSD